MLGKLFKHEMKACARLLLPIYLVLVVFTIMERIVTSLDIYKGVFSLFFGLITGLYVLSILAISVVSFVIIILRFYRNLMTDEGYLMFTLPVKPHQLINSKLFVSVIWTAISCIATVVSIFAVVITGDRLKKLQDGLQTIYTDFHNYFGNLSVLFILEIVILIIIAFFYSVLQIYVSIAVGQLFHGHKVIGSFAAYIVINTILQVLSTVIMAIAGLTFTDNFDDALSLPQIVFPVSIFITLIFTVLFYVATNLIFRKKINLD